MTLACSWTGAISSGLVSEIQRGRRDGEASGASPRAAKRAEVWLWRGPARWLNDFFNCFVGELHAGIGEAIVASLLARFGRHELFPRLFGVRVQDVSLHLWRGRGYPPVGCATPKPLGGRATKERTRNYSFWGLALNK